MEPLLELDAIAAYLQPRVPVTSIKLLNLPDVPEDNMLVLRFLDETQRTVNGFASENIRRWQVLYFNSRINKVVEVSHLIGKALIHGVTIPFTDANGKQWFVRVRAFQTGQPNKTESDLDYTLSILETKTSAIRSQEQYETMQEIAFNLTHEGG